jgi:glutathione S-transferase
MTHNLTALITLLAVLTFFWTALRVGLARGKYEVKAPATTGNEVFDRYFRVQMNTMEGLIQFLPSLWIFSLFGNEKIGAALGLIWIVGRILYALAYVKDPATRGRGFMIAGLSMLALQIGGLFYVIQGLIQNGI